MSFSMIFFYKKCNKLIERMTTPSKFVTYDETYCIWSLYIMKVMKVYIVVQGYINLVSAIDSIFP